MDMFDNYSGPVFPQQINLPLI